MITVSANNFLVFLGLLRSGSVHRIQIKFETPSSSYSNYVQPLLTTEFDPSREYCMRTVKPKNPRGGTFNFKSVKFSLLSVDGIHSSHANIKAKLCSSEWSSSRPCQLKKKYFLIHILLDSLF
jgi:hypothetical protein